MSTLDRRAVELRSVVQEILNQFQYVNAEVANGPHVDLSCQELRWSSTSATTDRRSCAAGRVPPPRRQLRDEHRGQPRDEGNRPPASLRRKTAASSASS
jgi:hypothetical protein